MPTPCILIVADPGRVSELASALDEPLPLGKVDVAVSSGGDDTIDLFGARRPEVVVLTASLEVGDSKSLIEVLRGMVPRAEVSIVLVGDDEGPIRTALDAMELAPDRFITRPLSVKALRAAVTASLENVMLIRDGAVAKPRTRTEKGTGVSTETVPPAPPNGVEGAPSAVDDDPTASTRAALRARWEKLADSIGGDDVVDSLLDHDDEPTKARGETGEEPAPLPPPFVIGPRSNRASNPEMVAPPAAWQPGTTAELRPGLDARKTPPQLRVEPNTHFADDRGGSFSDTVSPLGDTAAAHDTAAEPRERTSADDLTTPVREPTLIISDDAPQRPSRPSDPPQNVVVLERRADERWSEPVSLAALAEREPRGDLNGHDSVHDDLGLDDFDDDIIVGQPPEATPPPLVIRGGQLQMLEDLGEHEPAAAANDDRPSSGGRDFARQLRAKMSMMAQRLFQNDTASPGVEVGPRHDHHTEIDLASLGEEPVLGAGVTEIERERAADAREITTSPGSWDTQVREKGLPESGEIVRGVSDAAIVLAKVAQQGTTGRVGFRKDDVEKVVFFDQGRPVFASSNEPGDRMGELLLREGKITAAQFERCQTQVAQSGRRMGEILVDFGYLKRRELLPAVRRHVEDIIYSLFGWDRGHYHITVDTQASAERIRLSRHPSSLVLEGIRRKLDRSTLDKLVGPPSTVIEIGDRDRMTAMLGTADLAAEERAALAAFDGQADITQVARAVGVDAADILPLAWGLVVLGLAIARRPEVEHVEESGALVGETDLAIDRERVRARWQLVSEADYFALLGVRRDATAFEIRRAYQAARRDFAADCFPSDLRRELARELEDIASVLDEAFRVLRDDRLRLTYLQNLVE